MFHTPAPKNTTTSPAGQIVNHRPVVNLEMPLVRAIEQFKAQARVPARCPACGHSSAH